MSANMADRDPTNIGDIDPTNMAEKDPTNMAEKDPTNMADIDTTNMADRDTWSGKYDFILSMIAFSVGAGNIVNFPYKYIRNGRLPFLIAYVMMLAFIAYPIFYVEMALGQFSSRGPIQTFQNAIPIMGGIGVGMVIVSYFILLFYNMDAAWSLYYLYNSFTFTFLWNSCQNDFNTDKCFNSKEESSCNSNGGIYFQRSCYINITSTNNNTGGMWCKLFNDLLPEIASQNANVTCTNTFIPNRRQLSNLSYHYYNKYRQQSTEEFWMYKTLNISASIEETGSISRELVPCLSVVWLLTCLCIIMGIRYWGKIVYFTVLFPYIIIAILIIYGLTLDGAADGLVFLLSSDWRKLHDGEMWITAATTVFFSLSICFGGSLTLASYNKFNNNILRDSIIIALVDLFSSLCFCVFVVVYIGHLAKQRDESIEDIITNTANFEYVRYPHAVSLLGESMSIMLSILFYLLLILKTLDGQFGLVETVITALLDTFPKLHSRRWFVTVMVCGTSFSLDLVLVTQAGRFWVTLLSAYVVAINIFLIALLVSLVMTLDAYYGCKNLYKDIELMLGFSGPGREKFHAFHKFSATFLVPFTLVGITVIAIFTYDEETFLGSKYPGWAHHLGRFLAALPMMAVPAHAMYKIYTYPDKSVKIKKRIDCLKTMASNWGPSLIENHKGRYAIYGKLRQRTPEPGTGRSTIYSETVL